MTENSSPVTTTTSTRARWVRTATAALLSGALILSAAPAHAASPMVPRGPTNVICHYWPVLCPNR
ncbi:hypothetical protein AS25_08140 [Kocuria marina]|uniref:Uncharacterized protein n=1 Tax=Kocuria marina TaxID=223184 RepID=A0A0B0DDU3_9MICC|nr:hypothetical protein [Kocuria marina]KHE74327.1 hypothetical protein AS25_08140 [Kocuria marina]